MRPLSARSLFVFALLVALPLAGCVGLPEEPAPSAVARLAAAEVEPTGVVREFTLDVFEGVMEVGGTRTFGILYAPEGGAPSLPAPEIRVRQGDTVRVRLTDGAHTIHWHGVRLPWTMDGVPDMTQTLGEGTVTYEFVAKDAGTFWYHCHVHAPAHVDFGMFGAFIVEPADASVDPPFDREATLFLHEMDTRSFAVVDSAPVFGGGDPDALNPPHPWDAPEYARANAENVANAFAAGVGERTGVHAMPADGYHPRYDAFMINGKRFPDTEPLGISTGETVRIRLVNAGQLTHTMHLHGHRFLVTHKDGALLSAPYLADTIGLFPGERYDLYVVGDNPGHWDFHDHGGGWGIGGYSWTDATFPGGMQTTLVYEDWQMPERLAPVLEALARESTPSSASATPAATVARTHAHAAREGALPITLGLLA